MSTELSEEEQRLLPYMKNDLYQKYYSVIVRHFPIKSYVGHRLVDVGLLTISDYKEICNLSMTSAGPSLLCSLETKGNDSMATFYRVLVGARDERDVAVILQHFEEEAKHRRASRDVSWQAGVSSSQLCNSCLQGLIVRRSHSIIAIILCASCKGSCSNNSYTLAIIKPVSCVLLKSCIAYTNSSITHSR